MLNNFLKAEDQMVILADRCSGKMQNYQKLIKHSPWLVLDRKGSESYMLAELEHTCEQLV